MHQRDQPNCRDSKMWGRAVAVPLEHLMPYTTLQDIESLAAALSVARTLPDADPAKDLQITTLELRVQQSIDELDAGGVNGDDSRLVRLRSL